MLIENVNYVWKYCVKNKMKMMRHECTKLIFRSFNENVGYTVSLEWEVIKWTFVLPLFPTVRPNLTLDVHVKMS